MAPRTVALPNAFLVVVTIATSRAVRLTTELLLPAEVTGDPNLAVVQAASGAGLTADCLLDLLVLLMVVSRGIRLEVTVHDVNQS